MTDLEKQFKRIVAGLNIDDRSNTEHKQSLHKQMLDACQDAPSDNTALRIQPLWSRIMHSKITKRIAAAIFIAGILSLTLFDKTVSQVYAIEETLKAMQHIETMHLFGKDWGDNAFEMWIQLDTKTGIPEYVYDNSFDVGVLAISRPDKSYQYNKKSNRVLINSGKLYNINTAPGKIFEQLLKASKNPLRQATIDIYHEQVTETGKQLIVVYFETDKEARRIYIDPETKLPVRIEGLKNGHLGAIFKDIDHVEYNVELPEGIFEFEITDNMKVVDMGHINRQLYSPEYGISSKGLTENQAAEKIVTEYWNALIAGDSDVAHTLSPAFPAIVSGSQISELIEVGKPYIQNGCGIGKVVTCKLRFTDKSLKEIKLIVKSRSINKQPSCVIAGTWGGAVTIQE
ncbi:MAG: LolA family protein [Planctomycetota bacterium]|jgi:outer membrane lipoprotein-sorting protein